MKYLLQGLAMSLVCASVNARTYTFDASSLGIDNADVALFNQGGQLPGVYPVDILLNGERVGSQDVVFRQESHAQGELSLQPCLSVEMLSRYGVKVENYPLLSAGKQESDSTGSTGDCANLSAIPQATVYFQFYEQQLLLSIPQASLRPKLSGIAPRELWDDGIPAFLMNYRANTNRTEYNGGVSSSSDSQFIQLEPGANLGAWRLRNLSTWQKSGEQSGEWQTAYTYAEYGLYNLKSRLTLGERYTPSDIFDSVPFRGAMLGSDEAMVPFNQREFAPVVRGIARTQARVEVKQNGFTIYNATVAPGPFVLNDLSPGMSGGNLEVTVWETDGSPQVFIVPFNTPAIALREGYLKYNVMAGQYRAANSSVDEATVGQATVMYGLPWNLTAYGGAQGADHYQSAALGLGVSLGDWGGVSVDTTKARGQRKGQESETGGAWRMRYSKAVEATNTTLTLSNTQYSSSGYQTLSNVLDSYSHNSNGYSADQDQRKASSTLTLSQSLGEWGYFNLNGTRDSFRDRSGANDSFGASYGVGVGGGNLSLNWTQNRRAGTFGDQQNDQITSVMFSMPLNRWLGGSTNASYQFVSPSNGTDTQQVGLNGQGFDRRLSWDVRQRYRSGADSGDRNNSALQLRWYGGYGQLGGNYSYTPNIRQMGADVAGGVVMHRNGVTFGQPLSDTVALIEAPGASGVQVGGWPGVKTDFRGYTTQAYLNPYQENNVSLDPSNLPANAEITQTDMTVIPTQGAVIPATFATRIGARALMTLSREDGTSIPFGALAMLEGQATVAGVVDDKGMVYLSGLPAKGELSVKWGQSEQQQCRVNFQLPKERGVADMYVMNYVCR
ncbi:fimbrial biogenesis outer membrane usher protein [Yersinia ruckeri]|nr:fimbrial biogenesis outer membrane usher protein [Yersinia ruckeri]EEP99179.1 Outer membrane usher protein SfmD [Yersinia ruckeri ATCC 29473]MCK8539054.1 fimbrial biogenesis outer membrane usher protein [Yersinia ruckeri]MCK8541698.1 fimbrial biogenesis outer membrane usher protein [Yersinia ruckeri]MCK8550650.1 fimbrial biogenesis outer membrane usher protein [Yersinia ruckeri]MCK8554113.1 fimbrial biogenesis outer membrane usher protein [Yersinia ruckeri]